MYSPGMVKICGLTILFYYCASMLKKNEWRKPRLLIVLNRLVVGGQSIDTVPLANKLASDFDILIVYGEKEEDEQEYTALLNEAANVEFIKLHSLRRSVNPLNDLKSVWKLRKIIRKFKPDLVHTHGSKPGFAGRIAAKLEKTKCIIHTFHGNLFHSYYNSLVSKSICVFERKLASITDFIVALGEEQATELSEKYRIAPQHKIVKIPLGVDVHGCQNEATSKRQLSRTKYRLRDDEVAVAIIGRMVPVKNHRFFVKVIAELLPRMSDQAKFFFIGDGGLKKQLQDELSRSKIRFTEKHDETATVVFTSWVTPVTDILHGMDVIVVTSFNEGTPLSIIEAQLAGKPVVAVDAGGVKDTFIPDESGFLLRGYDVMPFAEKLRILIRDPDLRDKMGRTGAQFVASKYNKEKEVASMRHLYLKGCGSEAADITQTYAAGN